MQCSFDGVEIGFDRCEDEVEFTVVTYDIRSNKLKANDNFAPRAYAIAA